jgi:hypothetical protein
MERLQDLIALTFFLYYKTFTIKSRKFALDMIGFASKKGKLFTQSLWNIILKQKKRSKQIARRDRTLFIHAYEFSCSSTPQSSQSLRSRISCCKLLPCLSAKTLDVESNSVILSPQEMMCHSKEYYNNSGMVLALEGPQRYNSSVEQKSSSPNCDDMSGLLLPIEGPYSPAGARETDRGRICHATKSFCNGSGAILGTNSLWSPIGSKDEKFVEPNIDWLAEEFIQGFYQKLREQMR